MDSKTLRNLHIEMFPRSLRGTVLESHKLCAMHHLPKGGRRSITMPFHERA